MFRNVNRYELTPMTELDAAAISAWEYPTSYENDLIRHAAIQCADPGLRERQFRSVRQDGRLCGFLQWFPLTAEDGSRIIRLGLGQRPDLCGLGNGAGFVRFIVGATREQHPGVIVELEVDAGHIRARKAYEKAGFIAVDEYELPGSDQRLVPVVSMIWKDS